MSDSATLLLSRFAFFCFFFQAEDGIRDTSVTGVQTCALPIYRRRQRRLLARPQRRTGAPQPHAVHPRLLRARPAALGTLLQPPRREGGLRSEERRVGKEGRSRWWAYHLKKKIE